MLRHRVAEDRRSQADAGLVGAAVLDLGHRLRLAIDSAEKLIRPCLAGLTQGRQRAQYDGIGAQHHIDARVRQQDGAHGCSAAFLVDGQGRYIGDDGGAGNILQGIAHRDKARSQKLEIVVGQQDDVGLAAELAPDVFGRRVAEHLACQVLRRVQNRGRRRRNDRSDIGTRPDHLLQAVTE